MDLWNGVVELLVKTKDLLLGLSAEQITLISVVVTLVIFVIGQRSETKLKKHEIRRAEYKKFIGLLQKSLSGGIQPDEKGREEFFNTGVSLLLYGSKRVYKKYIFFREYSINPIVQKSKYNDKKVLLYIVADILKSIRHEVGLTSLSDLEPNETLSFFVNDIGTNPMSRIESYKSRYNVFMIKCEVFFYNRYKLLTINKLYYHIIKPVFGIIGMGFKYLLIAIGKLLGCTRQEPLLEEKPIMDEGIRQKDTTDKNKDSNPGQKKKQGFFKALFALEWRGQKWIAQNIWRKSRLIGRISGFCFVAFLAVIVLVTVGMIPYKIAYWLLLILGLIIVVCTFLKDSQKVMTTLGGFLEMGMCLMIVVGIVITVSVTTVFRNVLVEVTNQYVACVIISLVLALIWGTYSSFCAARVATLANALLAEIISMIILTKDLLIKTLFVEMPMAISSNAVIAQMEIVGYSTSQVVDGVFSLLFYPFLLMTGFAAMVCATKKYWIEKHNEQKDIVSLY